jgi:hypothetical protein
VPHGHDAIDSIDDALEASKEGVRAWRRTPTNPGIIDARPLLLSPWMTRN